MCGFLKMIVISVVMFQKYYLFFVNYYLIIGGPQLIFKSLSNH